MNTENSVAKCVPSAGVYCQMLAKRIRGTIHQAPGLGMVMAVQLGNPQPQFLGIGYKVPGLIADPGIMLTYCPWCGERILREDPTKD